MTYRFKIALSAQADADSTYEWISTQASPAVAQRWYRDLFQQIETLTRFPRRCPLIREHKKFSEEMRMLLYGKDRNKYRIIFTIRKKTVVVLHIHHGARNDIKLY